MKNKNFFSGMRLFYFTLLTGLLWTNLSYSQGKSIQILDKETAKPVSDVQFQYNSDSGFSDEDGIIEIVFSEGVSLFLSHLQYGKTEVKSNQVKTATQTGILKISFINKMLFPVTIINVHPDAVEKSYIEIPVQEKLEHDAGHLLEQFSAISTIRKSGSYGFDPVLRGFKYDQLNLVIDGSQTASAACPNRMDPASSQIPVNMISKVEVIKGPYSLRYGSAFGGTINFKSSSPTFTDSVEPVGRLGTSYESNGNIFRTEGVGGITGPAIDLKVFGSYSMGSNYTDGEGVEIPSGFNRLNWGGKLGFKLSEKQNIGLMVSNNRAKDVDFPSLPMDLRNDDTWLVNTNHTAWFYDKSITSVNTTIYYTKVNHLMDNFDKVIVPRTVDAETLAKTLNYGGRSEFRFDFNTGYLFSGIDYRYEMAEGDRTREMLMGPMKGKTLIDNVWQDAQIQKGGVFGEYHLEKSDFHLAVSGRLDFNKAVANDPAPAFLAEYPEMESSFLNPSLSAGGTKMINKKISVGLWLGTAQRSPGIAERYINFFPIGLDPYEMVGNPQLEPETNNQGDVIFQYETLKTNISVDLFTSFLRNYISSEIDPDLKPMMSTSPGVRRFINIDKALVTGFEIEWKQQLFRNIKHDLSVVYTYGEDQKLNEPLPEIPPLEIKYRLSGNFVNDKILPEILFRQVLKQDRIATSYGETESPAFNVFDFRLSWLATQKITVTGGVENIFDTAYYEHLSRTVKDTSQRPIYSPGRSFYATLTFNFL
jgi:iron complex outermembrane receptor protein